MRTGSNLNIIVFVIFILLQFCCTCSINGAVLFEENFDNQPDWASGQEGIAGQTYTWPETHKDNCTSAGVTCPPTGWNSYRVVESVYADPGRDTFIINSDGARGGSGKGLTQNLDSAENYGQWVGGSMNVWLGLTGYPELYVSFWAKYPQDWPMSEFGRQKMYRISTFDEDVDNNPSKNPFSFDAGRGNYPVCFTDWQWNYVYKDAYVTTSFRQAPSYTYINEESHADIVQSKDGGWHHYETHVKMNSAEGVADGQYDFYIDGVNVLSMHDVIWKASDSNEYGWNWIMFFDNATIPLDGTDSDYTVYYDDIKIATTYIGPDDKNSSQLKISDVLIEDVK